MGIGCDTLPFLPLSVSVACPTVLSPVPEAEITPEKNAAVADEPPASEPKPLSEKEIARAAAVKGIRNCLIVLACILSLAVCRARFDSFKELGRQIVGTLPQPMVQHPDRTSFPQN